MRESQPRRHRTVVSHSLEPLEARKLFSTTVESIDGSGNNLAHSTWGAAGTDLIRIAPATYGDGVSSPAGASRPSARAVSNAIDAQSTDIINNRNMSDLVYVFGQFLDHDIDLTSAGTTEELDVKVPIGDPDFDPDSTGTQVIPFTRSEYDPTTGTSTANPRQQITDITAFIDGSQIYGSDATRAAALRTFVRGQLKTSAGDLLPFNTEGLPNNNDAGIVPDDQLFLAGDVRANENIELTALQTLFMREHNRLAAQFAQQHPDWSDEQLYQAARRIVISELQSITVNEFLPALAGANALAPYRGYNPNVNPSVTNEFSTAAYRFGHSMLDDTVDRLNNDGTDIPEGSVDLKDAFSNPTLLNPSLPNHEGDIDPILKGAATGDTQEVDVSVVDDLRNFLFGPPGSGGFDLPALNIQRGRDHGLADYNTMRAAYGLPRVTSFAQITSSRTLQAALKQTYGSVNNIDPWVGGLAENHAAGSSLGPLFQRIIVNQFSRLRDGDRFWFENVFSGRQLNDLEHTTLADVIERNTSLTNLQPDVFLYSASGIVTPPPARRQPAPPPPPPPARGTAFSAPSPLYSGERVGVRGLREAEIRPANERAPHP